MFFTVYIIFRVVQIFRLAFPHFISGLFPDTHPFNKGNGLIFLFRGRLGFSDRRFFAASACLFLATFFLDQFHTFL